MPYYHRVGEIPHKRHTQFRRPDHGLYAEELMGAEGFSSDSALLYHLNAPSALVAAVEVPADPEPAHTNLPLLPHHLRTHDLSAGGDLIQGRSVLLANDDLTICYAAAQHSSALHRNAIGDELFYIESGRAVLESVFGALNVAEGDYVVIPTSVTHRWVITDSETVRALVVEAAGHVAPPRRYLSDRGQFLEHAPYCERDLRAPQAPLIADSGPADVTVKHRAGITRYTYAHHPFDVVGWDGCLYPYAFNIADFEPITGRIHQPPPVHQTFEGPNFVVCSFVPRKFDYHPAAVPAPYHHANIDSDEVLFYAAGDFMSRKGSGIGPGSISLHPAGFIHGPQPGSVEASLGKETTDELAVMIDTFRPLGLARPALSCEADDYPWTWVNNADRNAASAT